MILFDTNILVYVHNKASPNHLKAFQLESKVLNGELAAAVSAQNLLEFYATVTNPAKMVRPLPVEEANKIIKDYLRSPFQIIYPKSGDLEKAFELATRTKALSRKIFDVFLVATMLSNGVGTIYTQNEKDFRIFNEIRVVNPFE
jgi:predicted nucleic acid-binding protein